MIRVIFPVMTPGEVKALTFPFGTQMIVGETISTQDVEASVYSGDDPSPNDIVSGSATASGQNVLQQISAVQGLEGVTYNLVCTITTNAGQTLQCGGFLTIAPYSP